MIWNYFDEEERVLSLSSRSTSRRNFIPYAPPTPNFRFDGLTTATQTGIAESITRQSQQTLGLGIIAAGLAVFLGTRGAGYKPAGIIMNTGLQVIGEAYT